MKPELRQTRDYDIFELHALNRSVIKTDDLELSMLSFGFIPGQAIHARKNGKPGKLTIIDGHRRFLAAQRAGVPVWYIVSNDKAAPVDVEGAKKLWGTKGHLEAYVKEGRDDYIVVRDYHERTGIPLSTCISLLGGHTAGNNFGKKFRDGKYKVGARTIAAKIEAIMVELKNLRVEFCCHQNFVKALARVLHVKSFDPDLFLSRVKQNRGMMLRQPSVSAYLDMIEDVYNYRTNKENRLPLAWLASEAASDRNPCGKGQVS